MNNLFNKNKQLTDKLPDLPEVLDEVGTSNKSEKNKMMISLVPESTFDPSDSLFSTMDGECSAIITLNPPLKKLEDSDSTLDGESSAVIQPNPPLKRMKILDSTISTRSEVIVGNIHPSNVENVDHLNNSISNTGSPLDRSTPISDYDIAETEMGIKYLRKQSNSGYGSC